MHLKSGFNTACFWMVKGDGLRTCNSFLLFDHQRKSIIGAERDRLLLP